MKKKVTIWYRDSYPFKKSTEIKCDLRDLQSVLIAIACNASVSSITIEDLCEDKASTDELHNEN